MKLVEISASRSRYKKYDAVFEIDGKHKKVSFGAKKESGEPYSDFTVHRDELRKERYIQRHRGRENWSDPTSPGSLSRWILWNKPTLKESIADYRKKFRLD
jgi:hypothetical protein